jgi:hypothetical protein
MEEGFAICLSASSAGWQEQRQSGMKNDCGSAKQKVRICDFVKRGESVYGLVFYSFVLLLVEQL